LCLSQRLFINASLVIGVSNSKTPFTLKVRSPLL